MCIGPLCIGQGELGKVIKHHLYTTFSKVVFEKCKSLWTFILRLYSLHFSNLYSLFSTRLALFLPSHRPQGNQIAANTRVVNLNILDGPPIEILFLHNLPIIVESLRLNLWCKNIIDDLMNIWYTLFIDIHLQSR